MRIVGLLGIFALLGIAYLMSNNRRIIPWRTLVWGLLLQLLFAAILLGRETLSYAAMLVLLAMIVIYLFNDEIAGRIGRMALAVALMAATIAAGWLLDRFQMLGPLFWVLIAAIVVKAALRYYPAQKILAAGMLTTGFTHLFTHAITGRAVFAFISHKVEKFLALTDVGAEFLFGNLAVKRYFFTNGAGWPGFGFQFGFTVLPVIIFFACFMSILYHLGVMQVIIQAIARFMQWTMGTSGAETLSCAANIFIGQTEAPLLVRPFLNDMTLSELLTIMVGGFATIAGGVLAGYIAMGINAGHLIAASVMSAPAALVVAKLIFPETQLSKTAGNVEIPHDIVQSTNLLDAASRGVTDGLKLAVNVGAMLIAFIALIGLIDSILSILDRLIDGRLLGGSYSAYEFVSNMTPVKGEYGGIFPGSLKTLFGTLLRPLAWLMGVSWQFAGEVGNLLGIKLTLTEFVAYGTLAELINNRALDEKSIVIATYALCGFANFASIGIQIGGIGALVPQRRSELSRIGLKAMFGGAIASWITAAIAGILL